MDKNQRTYECFHICDWLCKNPPLTHIQFYKLQRCVILMSFNIMICFTVCKNLTVISFKVFGLQVTKAEKSDVCKWRVFAKPVTFVCVMVHDTVKVAG